MSFSAYVLIYQFFFYFFIHILAMNFCYNFRLFFALPYSGLTHLVWLRISFIYIHMYLNLKLEVLFYQIYLTWEKLVLALVPFLVISILSLTESVWLTPYSSSISELGTGCEWFVLIDKGIEAPRTWHIDPCGPSGCHCILIYV